MWHACPSKHTHAFSSNILSPTATAIELDSIARDSVARTHAPGSSRERDDREPLANRSACCMRREDTTETIDWLYPSFDAVFLVELFAQLLSQCMNLVELLHSSLVRACLLVQLHSEVFNRFLWSHVFEHLQRVVESGKDGAREILLCGACLQIERGSRGGRSG